MKNITVSVSDKAYQDARAWAAVNATSVSAAVQAYIEILVKTKSTPENLETINRIRQQARSSDREAAKNQAAAQVSPISAKPSKSAGILSAFRFFVKNHAETVQKRSDPTKSTT